MLRQPRRLLGPVCTLMKMPGEGFDIEDLQ